MTLLKSEKLIADIQQANKLQDLLDISRLKEEFKQIMKLIHPDLCGHPAAHEAVAKLNELKTNYELGKQYYNESGEFRTNGEFLIYHGKEALLQRSWRNYQTLMALTDEASQHFKKYLPKAMKFEEGKLHVQLHERAIPLSGKSLPQHHVLWVLSRMLEFSGWLAQVGYVHAGINPESVFVVPETHGIVVTSFYHLTLKNTKLNTLNAKYRNWYPPKIFKEKRAVPVIDLELCKKTAIYLMGDPSGSGIRLKKTHHHEFIDFVIAQDHEPFEAYQKYRAMLKRNFKSKFHQLDW
ncbi:MAG: hypothetical protein ACPGJS_13010 [Flammeovirgaceae bacterium]